MAGEIIRKGDPTSHHGVVLEGSVMDICMGQPIAYVGHKVHCPKCKGDFPIVEGALTTGFYGKGVALAGMRTSCGAVLIATQFTDTVEWGGAGDGMAGAREAISGNTMLEIALATSSKSDSKHSYHEQVRLRDEQGNPVAHTPYFITDGAGNSFKGLTDQDGCCERVYTDVERTLTILTGVPALENW